MRWDLLDDATLRFHSPLAAGEPGLYEERSIAFRAPGLDGSPAAEDWHGENEDWEDIVVD
jgi:hypothetical protein